MLVEAAVAKAGVSGFIATNVHSTQYVGLPCLVRLTGTHASTSVPFRSRLGAGGSRCSVPHAEHEHGCALPAVRRVGEGQIKHHFRMTYRADRRRPRGEVRPRSRLDPHRMGRRHGSSPANRRALAGEVSPSPSSGAVARTTTGRRSREGGGRSAAGKGRHRRLSRITGPIAGLCCSRQCAGPRAESKLSVPTVT